MVTVSLVPYVDIDSIDVDTLCNEMVEQASYKITDISATYNSCTVTVTTKNIDFYSLPETIYDEIKSEITDGTSSLWTSIKNSISSLLGGSDQTTIEKIDISQNLKNWYKETKKNGPQRKTTGKIVFGIKDGKWTLISFDERLIYGYYGLRPNTIIFQKFSKNKKKDRNHKHSCEFYPSFILFCQNNYCSCSLFKYFPICSNCFCLIVSFCNYINFSACRNT